LKNDFESIAVPCAAPCESERFKSYFQAVSLGDEDEVNDECDPIPPPSSVHDEHAIPHAIQRLVLAAKKPWPPATMQVVQDHWYRRGGMTLVMQEFFSFHMNRPDGELVKLNLTQRQMQQVRSMLDASGELEELLEAKIRTNMPEHVKQEMYEAKIKDLISDDSRYTNWGTLKQALQGRDVALVRGDWLVGCGLDGSHRLPKRQKLPDNGFWEKKDLADRLGDPEKKAAAVVSVSYCWRSTGHPDPDGEQLHLLAALVKEFASPYGGPTWHGEVGKRSRTDFGDLWQPVQGPEDVAIFIDWCSLYQLQRSKEEEDIFAHALINLEIWYAHRGTHVWMLTAVPEGVFTAGEKVALDATYTSRGWPTFEHCASTLLKDREMVFDMGKLPPLWRRWLDVVTSCKAIRQPPKAPDQFETELRMKRFMFKSDCGLLIEKYQKTYNAAICKALELNFAGVSWSPIQLVEIGALLPQCYQLQHFALCQSTLSEDSGCILAKAAPTCRTLVSLQLFDNVLGNRTAKALAVSLPICTSLHHLCLHMNEIGDDGAMALAANLPQTKLTVLRLDLNRIGSKGGAAFAKAITESYRLECLVICDNVLAEERKDAIDLAWRGAGKAGGELARQWFSLSLQERVQFDTEELEKYGGIIV
jgi:hypothetical protein